MQNCKKDKIVLIGTPGHGNLGDQAIAISEIKFLEDFKGNRQIFDIPMPLYKTHRNKLKKMIQRNDIIVISGGGWMGDLWIHNEITIREIVKDYLRNKIIIFPQTLYYSNSIHGQKVANETKIILNQHDTLYLSVRDKKSYNIATKKLGLNKVLFCPDMALYGNLKVDCVYKNSNKNIALLCLRSDIEKLSDSESIIKVIEDAGYIVKNTTTVKKNLIKKSNREFVVKNLICSYSKASFMVTDRLHAMIFALLAGIPCYVFNNATGKVFGVGEYLQKTGMPILMFENISSVHSDSFCLRGKEYELEECLMVYFKKLSGLFNSNIERRET